MRSYAVLLALLPLCFAAPNVHMRDEVDDGDLTAGRTCLHECQVNVHREFNECTDCRPRDHKEYCEFAERLGDCFAKCPDSPATPLLRQDAEINAQVCAMDFDERNFTAFLENQDELFKEWYDRQGEACRDGGSPGLETCSEFLNCFFGEALNAVKDDFDELAVASLTTQFKIQYTLMVGRRVWTEAVVKECAVLFKPYEARNAYGKE